MTFALLENKRIGNRYDEKEKQYWCRNNSELKIEQMRNTTTY